MITIPNALYINGMRGIIGALMVAYATHKAGWEFNSARKEVEELLEEYTKPVGIEVSSRCDTQDIKYNYYLSLDANGERIADIKISIPIKTEDPLRDMEVTDSITMETLYLWFSENWPE